MWKLIFGVSLLILAACAKQPDAIVAADVPEILYDAKTCGQLKFEKAETAVSLGTLSAQQSTAATSDAVGVLFIGLPISSMAGNDVSGKIAEAKGRIAAMDAVMARKHCAAET